MNCQGCGAEVKMVEVIPTGEMVVLDAHAREYSGPNRYMVEGDDAGQARPVSERFEGYAYGDHSKTCPLAVKKRERRERL